MPSVIKPGQEPVLTIPRWGLDRFLDWCADHPRAVDMVWAGASGALLGFFIAQDVVMGASTQELVFSAILAVLTVFALLHRSRTPMGSLCGTWLVSVVGAGGSLGEPFLLMVVIALYTVVATQTAVVASFSVAMSMALGAVADLVWLPDDYGYSITMRLFSGWFWVFAAALLALAVRHRRDQLIRRDADLQTAIGQLREQAERRHLCQRMRVANDLHDSVGHSLTAIIALAGGGALSLPDQPEEAHVALTYIERTAKDSLGRVREVVDRLHQRDSAAAPSPAGDIDHLVETIRAAGLPVDFVHHGETPTSDGVAEAGFHVVQEGLTNVLRHARDVTCVTVMVDHGPDATTVEVLDDGIAPSAAVDTAGHGLAGLRDRVESLHGTFDAGPVSPRGWRLRATLPHEEATA